MSNSKYLCRKCRRSFRDEGRSKGFNKVLCESCGEDLTIRDTIPKSYKGLLDKKHDWNEEVVMKDTIKIIGYSVGDYSVGIGSIHFEVDLGIVELTKDDKEFLINGMIRDLWELHDNGNLRYHFSDEIEKAGFDYTRVMTYEMSEIILRKSGVKV